MKRLESTLYWLLILFCCGVFGAMVYGASCSGDEPAPFEPSDEATLVYEDAQRHRANSGLSRQTHDVGLASIAQRVANYQAHIGGMTHTSLGDNVVAVGMPPRGMVSLWINSGPHRAFLLGGSTHCGYGFARSAGGQLFAAGIFRSAGCAVCDPNDMSGIGGSGGGRSRRGWFRRR